MSCRNGAKKQENKSGTPSVIPLVPIKRTSGASGRLVSEQPHIFAICPQSGVHFWGEVYALIDDHASFAGG